MIDGWNRLSLNQIAKDIVTGTTPNTSVKDYYNGSYIFVSPADINKDKYIKNSIKTLTNKGFNQTRKLPIGSVLVTCIGDLGKIAIASKELCTNQQINAIICKNNISNEFIYYQILNNKSELEIVAGLQVVPLVNKSEFSKIKINMPSSIKEQQKIAKILTSVDESIEATNKIIAKQKRVKTALMQDLLTRGIDENGNIRSEETHEFKDSVLGRIPKEWKTLELKYICTDFIVPMRDKPKVFRGDIPWCRIEDFNGKFLSKTKSNQYVDNNTVKQMNLKIHPVNTVLCSCSAVIGKTTIVKKPLVTNQTFIGLVPNDKSLNSEFLYYLLPTYIQRLENLSSGTTIVYLSREKFETFKIIVPPVNEQHKIAVIFSKQDEAIEQEEQKLHKLQRVKIALMQDLLTGKVRVNYE